MYRTRFIPEICSGGIKHCKNTFANFMHTKLQMLAEQEEKVIFGGRLGEYKYYDMDAVIAAALTAAGDVR